MPSYTSTSRLIVLLFFLLIAGTCPVLGEQHTMNGTLNTLDQFISDSGDIYEIADTDKGAQLLYEGFDANIILTGDVIKDDEIAIVAVESYQLFPLPDEPPSDEDVNTQE